MNLDEKIRTRINESEFGSEERNVLRTILGECTRSKVGTGRGATFLQRMIRTNKELLRDRRRDPESDRIRFETKVLESLLQD
jgi:hypothetical protein